jgi:hypothetical protein
VVRMHELQELLLWSVGPRRFVARFSGDTIPLPADGVTQSEYCSVNHDLQSLISAQSGRPLQIQCHSLLGKSPLLSSPNETRSSLWGTAEPT